MLTSSSLMDLTNPSNISSSLSRAVNSTNNSAAAATAVAAAASAAAAAVAAASRTTDNVLMTRPLFDKPNAALIKLRRDVKMQKIKGWTAFKLDVIRSTLPVPPEISFSKAADDWLPNDDFTIMHVNRLGFFLGQGRVTWFQLFCISKISKIYLNESLIRFK